MYIISRVRALVQGRKMSSIKFSYFFTVHSFQTFSVLTSKDVQHKVTIRNVSHCADVQEIFISKKEECSCKDWQKGVNQLQEGSAKVFKNYPGVTNAIGETIITSFKIYSDRLISWTVCNSTILSTSSISILQALSLLSTVGKSASYIVNENAKATPSLVSAYMNIVSELSNHIGALVHPINDVIIDLGRLSEEISKQFQSRFVGRESDNVEKINFQGIMKCGQLMANTIGLIAETALDDCGCVTIPNDTFDAIAILIILLNDNLMGIQYIIVSIAAVLHSESSGISEFLHSSLLTLDPFIQDVGDVIASMTLDINQSVRVLLTKVVSYLYPLNEALDNLLGPSEGAKITVAQIKMNLLRRG